MNLEKITFGEACFFIALISIALIAFEPTGFSIYVFAAAVVSGIVGYLRVKYDAATTTMGKVMYVGIAVAFVAGFLLLWMIWGLAALAYTGDLNPSYWNTPTYVDGGI
jgi:hypothetical protein